MLSYFKIPWPDGVRNEEVLRGEDDNVPCLLTIMGKRTATGFDEIFRHEGLLNTIFEDSAEESKVRARESGYLTQGKIHQPGYGLLRQPNLYKTKKLTHNHLIWKAAAKQS